MTSKLAFIAVLLLSVIGVGGSVLQTECKAFAVGAQEAAQATIARRIGTIKTINGSAITLTSTSGAEVAVTVQPNARIVRIAPGEKDVKNATPVQLQELQVGDTIRARGTASDDGKSINALEIVVITRSTVDAVGEQIRQDWLKRGLAGPVSAVDPSVGTVTISQSSFGAKKTITIRASKSTVVRRYAPDSAKFEDAKPSTLPEIHVGDQLRARGERSADGSELTAEEIVTGNFPNFAGLIKSLDATAGTISLQDVVTKKTVQLKITADSQLHSIPAETAQRFAMRLKGAASNGTPGSATNSASTSTPAAGANGQAAPGGSTSGGAGGGRPGGGFDLQRLLDQTPAVALADLHKGDAVAVLATEGTPSGGNTVIKLFSGVEPILQASPNGSQAMMLAPWSLGGAPGGDAGNQ
jgi:hypothetical protein